MDLSHIYWLVLLLCSFWFYQSIFMGMGYYLLTTITNNSKRILYYCIYVRLLTLQSCQLHGEAKGKILNTLT